MLHPHRITLTLICLLALQSCQEDIIPKMKVTFGEEELVIPLMKGGTTLYAAINVGTWYGEDVLGYYNYFEERLELYSIDNQDSITVIPIQKEGPDAVGNFSRFYLIDDLIYVHSKSIFYVLNGDGEVVDKSPWMRFNEESNNVKSYRLWETVHSTNLSSYQPKDSFLYLNYLRADESMDDPRYYTDNPHPIVKYDIRSHLFTPLPVKYPDQIIENIHTIGNTGGGRPQVDVHGDTVVYNFRYHDDIYQFTGNKVNAVSIPSSYFPESNPNVLNSMDKKEAYKTANWFDPIQYDPYRNLYIRSQAVSNFFYEGKSPSISIISTDLKLLEEVEIPKDLKLVFFFRPEAIYIAVHPDYLSDENNLRFRPIYVEWE